MFLYFIGSRSQVFIILRLRKSFNCWAKKLKYSWLSFSAPWSNIVRPWSRSLIFVVDHFSQLGFERIICIVNLCLEMRFDRLWGKDSRWIDLFLTIGGDLRKSSLFFFSGVLFLRVNSESLLFIETPIHYCLGLRCSFIGVVGRLRRNRVRHQSIFSHFLIILVVNLSDFIHYLRFSQRLTSSLPWGGHCIIYLIDVLHVPGPMGVSLTVVNRFDLDLNWCPPSSLIFTIIMFLFSYLLTEGVTSYRFMV